MNKHRRSGTGLYPSSGFMLRSLISVRPALLSTLVFWLYASVPSGYGAEMSSRWAILIAGVSGDPDLQQNYLKELTDLHAVLTTQFGFPNDHVRILFGDPAKNPAIIQHRSTRENVQSVLKELASRVKKEDLVFVFIEGGGSYDGSVYKLNLVGPDMDARELASLLYSIPAGRHVVVNATSCSGASIPAFSKPGKVVITSTKSGAEKNRTHFGEFFVKSVRDAGADSDKDGRISMAEAFQYASRKVEEYYERDGSLQTEHPVIDEDGNGAGPNSGAASKNEGLLARTIFLDSREASGKNTGLSPEQQKLAQEARSLETQIEALKSAKAGMSAPEYESRLEDLLLRLAEINAKLPKEYGR